MTKFATPPLPIHKYKQSLPAFTATRKSVSQPTTSPFASLFASTRSVQGALKLMTCTYGYRVVLLSYRSCLELRHARMATAQSCCRIGVAQSYGMHVWLPRSLAVVQGVAQSYDMHVWLPRSLAVVQEFAQSYDMHVWLPRSLAVVQELLSSRLARMATAQSCRREQAKHSRTPASDLAQYAKLYIIIITYN